MHRTWVEVAIEQIVELVVQRADALHQRDVLGDAGEVTVFGGRSERLGEVCGDLVEAGNGTPVGSGAVRVRPEHGNEATREHGLDDLAVVVSHLRRNPRRAQHRLLPEDRRIELLEPGTRIDSHLVRQHSPRLVVGLERLGLPPRSVERKHQLPPQPLPQRIPLDKRFELRDEARTFAELEVGVDSFLERVQPQLLEPADLGLRERLERQVGERRATPQRQRLTKLCCSIGRLGASCSGDEPLEPPEVKAVRVDRQDVARRAGHQGARP